MAADDDDEPGWMRAPWDQAPLAVAAAVMAFVWVGLGGDWGRCGNNSSLAFGACVGLLLMTLALSVPRSRAAIAIIVDRVFIGGGGKSGMGGVFETVEGFYDSAKAIADDLLMTRLDRLALGLQGKNADGSESSDAADEKVAIKPDRFVGAGVGADAAKRLQLEYRRISFVLCRLGEAFPERFRAATDKLGGLTSDVIYSGTPPA